MRLRRGARAVLWGLASLLILFSTLAGPGVTLEPPWLTLLAGGGLCVLAGIGVALSGISSRAQNSALGVVAFFSWLVLAWILGGSLEQFRSKVCLSGWVGFVGIFFAVLASIRRREEWRALAWTLVLTCLALSLYGLVAFQHFRQERLLSTFINADCFSLFPVAGLLVGLGLFHQAKTSSRILIQINVMVQFLTLALTGSRAGLLGLAVGILVLAILLWLRTTARNRRPMVDTLSPLLLAFILMGLGSLAMPGLGRWEKVLKGQETEGITMRQDVLAHGMKAIIRRPIFGSGAGTFALAYQEFRPASILSPRMYVNVAHDDYVELGVESGFPALVLWFVVLAVALERAARFARRSPLGHEVAATAAAVTAVVVYSTLNFVFAVPADLFLLSILLGLSVAPTHSGDTFTKGKANRINQAIAGLLVIAGLWCINFNFRAYRAYEYRRSADLAFKNLEVESAQQGLTKALQLLPERPENYLKQAQVLTYLSELTGNRDFQKQAVSHYELAYRWGPNNLGVVLPVAQAYSEAGKIDEAAEILKKAIQKAGYFDKLRLELANVYLRKGQIAEAAAVLCPVYERDDSNDNDLRRRLAKLLALSECSKPGSVEKIFLDSGISLKKLEPLAMECSETLLKSQKYLQADQVLKAWGRLNGEDSCVWLQRSKIWSAAGDANKRMFFLEKAADDLNASSPCYEKALLEFTEVASASGRLKEVENRLNVYMNRNAGGTMACAALIRLYLRKKDLKAARQLLTLGLEKQDRDPDLLALRARMTLIEGSPESAAEQAKMILEVDQGNAEAQDVLRQARAQLDK